MQKIILVIWTFRWPTTDLSFIKLFKLICLVWSGSFGKIETWEKCKQMKEAALYWIHWLAWHGRLIDEVDEVFRWEMFSVHHAHAHCLFWMAIQLTPASPVSAPANLFPLRVLDWQSLGSWKGSVWNEEWWFAVSSLGHYSILHTPLPHNYTLHTYYELLSAPQILPD